MSLSGRLKNRVDLYAGHANENELDETDFDYVKVKSIWAEITPQSGR